MKDTVKEWLKKSSPLNNRTDMPTALFVVKKLLAFGLCYLVGLLLAEGAVILLHFACGKNMLVGDVFDAQTITLITYYGYLIVAMVTLAAWKWLEKKPLAEMGLTRHPGSYVFGALIGVLLVVLSVAVILWTGNLEYLDVSEHVDVPLLLLLLGGFVVQGATEEILCRGFAFHALREKVSVGAAMDIVAVLFVLPHLPSLFDGGVLYGVFGILNLLLISAVFSLLTLYFRSIWAACGLHSFWNAVLYGVFGLNLSGNEETVTAVFRMRSVGENLWNGGPYGPEASILTTVVLALAAALLWYGLRKRQKRDAAA